MHKLTDAPSTYARKHLTISLWTFSGMHDKPNGDALRNLYVPKTIENKHGLLEIITKFGLRIEISSKYVVKSISYIIRFLS